MSQHTLNIEISNKELKKKIKQDIKFFRTEFLDKVSAMINLNIYNGKLMDFEGDIAEIIRNLNGWTTLENKLVKYITKFVIYAVKESTFNEKMHAILQLIDGYETETEEDDESNAIYNGETETEEDDDSNIESENQIKSENDTQCEIE